MEKGGETWNENIGSMIQFCVRLYMHANNLFITNYQRCTHTQYNWINIQQINTLLYGAARKETRKSPKTPKTETLPNKGTSIFNLTGHMKPVSKNIYLFDTTQHNTTQWPYFKYLPTPCLIYIQCVRRFVLYFCFFAWCKQLMVIID